MHWAVVLAQLAEYLLPIPEVRNSNPVSGDFLYRTFIYCQLYWKENVLKRKKSPGPLKKRWCTTYYTFYSFGAISYLMMLKAELIIIW